MDSVIAKMLNAYPLTTSDERDRAFREVVQEVILCGLQRAGLFEKTAFYGGTALRVFHGIPRFSEDLDFSLLSPEATFRLSDYFVDLQTFLKVYGLNFAMERREKSTGSNVETAVAKGNRKEHVLRFFPEEYASSINKFEVTRIRFEISLNPPDGATYEIKRGLSPQTFSARLYDMPSMFASKIGAVLTRAWKTRSKGRDLYDYLFFLSSGTQPNMKLLKNSLVSADYIDESFALTKAYLTDLLEKKFSEIDFDSAKKDVAPFIRDQSELAEWDKNLFIDVTKDFFK